MTSNPTPPEESLEPLLDFLTARRLLDFGAYTPAMLRRRLNLRRQMLSLPDLNAYYAYLSGHLDEIDHLLAAMSITVSHFFRNPLTFALLREKIIPELISTAGEAGVRIWCAGCGQGEEPYSLAILVHDYCLWEEISIPVMILATDIDQESLRRARRAWYRPNALDEVGKRFLDRYFKKVDDGYQLEETVRSLVTFAHHDLTCGTPPSAGIFSDYQLICCRNVLIYFKQERGSLLQQRMAAQLRPGGWLALGEAEAITPMLGSTLREVVANSHIFRKG